MSDLFMKKLILSETKYIRIDTIDKDVEIVVENLCDPDFMRNYSARARVPLSLIKLLTEINKHVFLENSVLIYDLNKIESNRQHYFLTGSRFFYKLVELNDNLIFSPMILNGYNRYTRDLWTNNSPSSIEFLPEFTIQEWAKLIDYVNLVSFTFNPRAQYRIFCDMIGPTDAELYWDHESDKYLMPSELEE